MEGLAATRISMITITRDDSVKLHRATRKMLSMLSDDFKISDIEYTADPNSDKGTFFSVMIIGTFDNGSYIDLNANQTAEGRLDTLQIVPIMP